MNQIDNSSRQNRYGMGVEVMKLSIFNYNLVHERPASEKEGR